MPSRLPMAVLAANCGPCSSARKNRMGPELKGIPSSHPEKAAPHLRPARLTRAIITGARTILNRSTENSKAKTLNTEEMREQRKTTHNLEKQNQRHPRKDLRTSKKTIRNLQGCLGNSRIRRSLRLLTE